MPIPYADLIHFYRDANGWCAILAHFSDEETSHVGRGETIQAAADDLGKKTGRWEPAPPPKHGDSNKATEHQAKNVGR